MDHVPAAEVHGAVLGEPAAAPDQEGVDRVDEGDPQDDERDPRLEVHAAEDRSQHQDRGDRGEYELEVDERGLWEVEHPGRAQVRDLPLALELVVIEDGAGLPDEVVPEASLTADRDRRAEAHLEGIEHPHEEHDGECDERQHHAVHGPALLHDAAVEHDEAGHAHQTDERRRRHLPRVVAGVQPLRVQHRASFSAGNLARSPRSPNTKKTPELLVRSSEATLPPRAASSPSREVTPLHAGRRASSPSLHFLK